MLESMSWVLSDIQWRALINRSYFSTHSEWPNRMTEGKGLRSSKTSARSVFSSWIMIPHTVSRCSSLIYLLRNLKRRRLKRQLLLSRKWRYFECDGEVLELAFSRFQSVLWKEYWILKPHLRFVVFKRFVVYLKKINFLSEKGGLLGYCWKIKHYCCKQVVHACTLSCKLYYLYYNWLIYCLRLFYILLYNSENMNCFRLPTNTTLRLR